jgi:hypothetical protein
MRHFMYVPFTGLGLYGGYRGKAWLKNRIQVFKQFVVPSLQAQTSQNFMIWVSWRPEERTNKQVQDLKYFLDVIFPDRVIFTYNGVCFWDDKYPDEEARRRLLTSLHHSMTELVNLTGDVSDVLMTIQPSDDCYYDGMVEETQRVLSKKKVQAYSYTKGYIVNYQTLETREYNPETHPPFYTIKFPKHIFIDPYKHADYTGPYKSHEYAVDKLKGRESDQRGFLVGTHGENISTHFNIPYAGEKVENVLNSFGLGVAEPVKICYSIRKKLMRKLPHRVQRKLRYIFGERLYQRIYKLLHG